ncbi:ABC transporter ATPase, partial [Lutibacter sp.]
EIIKTKLDSFIENWQGHGDDLKASYQLKYNQFIILAVDEKFNEVSGCSIDASVNLIKQFEKEFMLDLTNKLNISFKDNKNINIVSLTDFKHYVKQGKINLNTIVFNNMVTSKADYINNWEVTADKSWHKRFFV